MMPCTILLKKYTSFGLFVFFVGCAHQISPPRAFCLPSQESSEPYQSNKKDGIDCCEHYAQNPNDH